MTNRGWIFSLGLMLPLALAPAAHAAIFGDSDAEIAARQAHEDGQDARIDQLSSANKALEDRIRPLEDKIQSLTQSLSQATGSNEELAHQIQLLNDKIDREEKDFSYRLCMLSAQQLGAGGDQGLNCASAGTASAVPASPGPGGLTPGAALPPLGSNTGLQNNPGNFGPPQATRLPGMLGSITVPSGPPPQQNSSGQFDAAMNLLAKAQYAEASAAFRAFADANPDDSDLSPQAIYWIGDIAFVQQDYPTAVSAFAEEIKKYPTSSRSPDSMLKLGQSLLATGQTSQGCVTLAALRTKYPKASASTLAAAAGARKTSCSK
jgi:tol-pal system protein YbgF